MKNIVKRLLINYFQLFLKIPSSYEPDHSRWDSHSFTACNRLIAKKFVRIGGTGGWRRRMARPVAVDYDGRGGRWLKGRLLAAGGEGMGGRWELEHRGGGRGQAAFGAGERRRGGGRRGGGGACRGRRGWSGRCASQPPTAVDLLARWRRGGGGRAREQRHGEFIREMVERNG